ncbi:hypothetical protein SUGI_0070600 [Cryptomeria japonica]|uniref:oil body-associated protein 1A n=1 Tax=Cryptomeria japonica TaxID=3369 RepID=UPI002408D44F|nr:oil body-associated protein 1A [Cryptomeria japonica]GLJ07600.1 hypothetical protein SUGI_0070600 [Cryptomeria japonica]
MAAAGPGPISKSIHIPGEPSKTSTSMLETGTELIQNFAPIKNVHEHLCAFHFYAHDMTRQIETHHFCSHINEDVRQCLLYDSPEKNARLIGVEYMVSEKLFLTLPDEEKKLWHSHEYEVKSGVLFMPGIPGPIQRQGLEKVCKTYGKVFHFWQFDKGDTLPLGLPQLMMAFTVDGQLHEQLATDVQERYNYSFQEEREKRQYMSGPDYGINPLGNSWTSGKGLKTVLRETDCQRTEL